MKKMLSIILAATLAVGGTSVAMAATGTRTIQAAYNNIKIFVDGKQVTTNAEPFTYNGTTYLPVRAVSQALGKEVSWDAATKTVYIGQKPTNASTPSIENTVYNSNGVKISYLGKEQDSYGDIDLKFRIENNSKYAYTIQTRDESINGTMISAIMSQDIQPGKNAITKMSFSDYELADIGITSVAQVKNVEFKFHIFNNDDFDNRFDSSTIKINN